MWPVASPPREGLGVLTLWKATVQVGEHEFLLIVLPAEERHHLSFTKRPLASNGINQQDAELNWLKYIKGK